MVQLQFARPSSISEQMALILLPSLSTYLANVPRRLQTVPLALRYQYPPGSPDEILISWLQPSPSLAIINIRGVNQEKIDSPFPSKI